VKLEVSKSNWPKGCNRCLVLPDMSTWHFPMHFSDIAHHPVSDENHRLSDSLYWSNLQPCF